MRRANTLIDYATLVVTVAASVGAVHALVNGHMAWAAVDGFVAIFWGLVWLESRR